ncbi:hypothetical protein BS78_06G188600 [Paspalum vaginatum]|nr:hypothetical protein BS78_06G188600 [Paspalum vaginatum]
MAAHMYATRTAVGKSPPSAHQPRRCQSSPIPSAPNDDDHGCANTGAGTVSGKSPPTSPRLLPAHATPPCATSSPTTASSTTTETATDTDAARPRPPTSWSYSSTTASDMPVEPCNWNLLHGGSRAYIYGPQIPLGLVPGAFLHLWPWCGEWCF